LGAVTWRVMKMMGFDCSIDTGFDRSKHLEYIEISCHEDKNLECIASALWSIKGGSITKPAWSSVDLCFDEGKQSLVFKAGGFPRNYRWLQDLIMAKPTKYFYGRGFSVEALRNECVKKQRGRPLKPTPSSGFIDFSLRDAIPYLFGLNNLRKMLRTRVIDRIIHVLLIDLGDRDLGLLEAVDILYSPSYDASCIHSYCRGTPTKRPCISLRSPEKNLGIRIPTRDLRIDLGLWMFYSIVLSLMEHLISGSIELLSKWPTLALVTYRAGRTPRGTDSPRNDDTRSLGLMLIHPETLFASLHGLSNAAQELGTTPYRLVRALQLAQACIADLGGKGRGEKDYISSANAIASRLIPLIDSCLRGHLDRDLLYGAVRMIKGVEAVSTHCSAALRMLG